MRYIRANSISITITIFRFFVGKGERVHGGVEKKGSLRSDTQCTIPVDTVDNVFLYFVSKMMIDSFLHPHTTLKISKSVYPLPCKLFYPANLSYPCIYLGPLSLPLSLYPHPLAPEHQSHQIDCRMFVYIDESKFH